MSGALTQIEAHGPTLDEVLLAVLRNARLPARTADCPVCGGAMRRLVEASLDVTLAANELVCGDCGSVLVDEPPRRAAGQLRLVG